MGRAVEAEIDLALEAQPQQAPGNGTQVINALANGDLNGTPAAGSGAGVEIGQPGEDKSVAGLCHFQAIGFGDHSLTVQGEAAVHLRGTHGNNDDIVAF